MTGVPLECMDSHKFPTWFAPSGKSEVDMIGRREPSGTYVVSSSLHERSRL